MRYNGNHIRENSSDAGHGEFYERATDGASGEPHSGRRQASVDQQDVAGYEACILAA